MQHKDVEIMDQTLEDMEADLLAAIPVEKRLQSIPVEQRLQSIPVEMLEDEILQAIPVERRLQGLSPEALRRLREILDQRLSEQNEDPS